jgi:hypothetical protein
MFLEPSSAQIPESMLPPAPQPRKQRRHFGIWMGVAILLGIAASIYIGIAATRVVQGGVATRSALMLAKTHIADTDFSGAREELTLAADGVAEAKAGAGMVGFVSHVPWVGTRYDAAVGMLDATQNTIDVLIEAVTIANDVYGVVSDARQTLSWRDAKYADTALHDLPTSVKRALFVRLADALPDLQEMQVKLELASVDIAEFQKLPEMEAFHDLVVPFANVVEELKTSVDFLVPFAGVTREFAGLRGERQFLLMFMNDTELRPTGGFLGTYGLLVIRDGDMKSLSTDDVYAVDVLVAGNPAYNIASPAPIAKYLEQPIWFFRDGTWSPDFATGAQETTALMRQEFAVAGLQVPHIDGVIGITTGFLEKLLAFVGPVTVNGTEYTVQNATEVLEYQVEIAFEQQGIAREDRKDVVGVLTNAVLDALLEISPSRFAEVFALLSEGFVHKDLVMYSSDVDTQAVLEDYDWAGAVGQEDADDFLMLVDANMASLKSDPVVERAIAYSLVPFENGYRATAAVTYNHTGSFDWKTSRYRTYARIFVPEGARLVSVEGSLANDAIRNPQGLPGEVTTSNEFGLTSFGTFTSIEPGQSRTLTFVYTLPKSVGDAIAAGSYTLRMQKQIGAEPPDVVLNLDFNKNIQDASPAEESTFWGDEVYSLETSLGVDQEFSVEL